MYDDDETTAFVDDGVDDAVKARYDCYLEAGGCQRKIRETFTAVCYERGCMM